MPPLRKKGRGGGGGKTEALLPGQLPGVSPSVILSVKKLSGSHARKESGKDGMSTDGLENLSALVSRSFQKERGERRLLESTRTSLHLATGFPQKVARGRKAELNIVECTPRVVDLSYKSEDRDKVYDVSHRASAPAFKSSCRAREEPTVCRTTCREMGEEKVWYRRSVRATDEKLIRKISRKDEKTVEFSSRYTNVASRDVKDTKLFDVPPKLLPLTCSEKADDSSVSRSSPTSSDPSKLSPQNFEAGNANSPGAALPVRTGCSCGAFRISDSVNSPAFQERLTWIGVEDKVLRRGSPVAQGKGLESSKQRSLQGTPGSQSKGASGSLTQGSNTPNLLHGRLALLEGRVTEIAAELKATKDLLDANNPACSKALLADIQTKISGIEKAMNFRLARECGLGDQLEADTYRSSLSGGGDNGGKSFVDERKHPLAGRGIQSLSGCNVLPEHGPTLYGKASKSIQSTKTMLLQTIAKHESPSVAAGEDLSHIAAVANSRSKDPSTFRTRDQSIFAETAASVPAGLVKPVFNHTDFEERLFPHQKLLKNRSTGHQKLIENRAALHQKLMENSVLLRNKLAALEAREGLNCSASEDGDIVAAQLLTSLKQVQTLGIPRHTEFQSSRSSKVEVGTSNLGVAFPVAIEAPSSLPGTSEAPSSFDRGVVDNGVPDIISNSRKCQSKSPKHKIVVEGNVSVKSSGSRGGPSERKRRSLEKRKSVSSSEGCSPEPTPAFHKMVMMEPSEIMKGTTQQLNRQTRGFQDENTGVDTFSKQSATHYQQARAIPKIDAQLNLDCQESLAADDEPDFGIDTNDYNCAAFLEECDNVDSVLAAERLHSLGTKIAAAGWFTSEGDGILLAHDDGQCSYYDVANLEEKVRYRAPERLPPGIWRDCWIIRAAGPEGQSNKYVVAASGGAVDSAFCVWDFYQKKVTAYKCESPSLLASPSRLSFKSCQGLPGKVRNLETFLPWQPEDSPSLSMRPSLGSARSESQGALESESLGAPLWWYRPCSPLLASAASGLKTITLYDIRDGDIVMKWDLSKWVANMDFSSPLQWRNRNKIVIAEDQGISLWDVNSTSPHRLHNINLLGKQLQALYVRNSDSECAGVRQRATSKDSQGGDGVVCTTDAVHVLDFRVPAGIAQKIPTLGDLTRSVFVTGDTVFAGITNFTKGISSRELQGIRMKGKVECKISQWSMRQAKPIGSYCFPQSGAHESHMAVSQVWGSSKIVMGVNGNGLYMFDALNANALEECKLTVRATLGTNDLLQPSFDYANSRVLLISRDRPASWCYWP